ncbi:MAG: diguanylate cyclase domain-containing protein [Dehalococcoidia bacterium]
MEALYDALTGAFSWAAFSAFAEASIAETRRREGALGLLFVSVEGFGRRNIVDDSLLQEAGLLMLRTMRGGDLLGRAGLDRFAVLAQAARPAGAVRLAERIQAALPVHQSVRGQPVPFNVAIGIATLPDVGSTLEALIDQATAALMAASREGGRATRLWSAVSSGAPVATSAALGPGELMAQRRTVLAQLTQAWERQEIAGIVIQPQAGACPVCLDIARDVYSPRWAPPLPLVGCSGPVGCRCHYGAAAPVEQQDRPPTSEEISGQLSGGLRRAARFGAEPQHPSSPEEMAEFLDRFRLPRITVDLSLESGEFGYVRYPSRRAWERRTGESAATHGPVFPPQGPLLTWVRKVRNPPNLPLEGIPYQEEGVVYLTSRRLLFRSQDTTDSIRLTDISAIEYLKDGIACILNDRPNRLVLLLREPLLVGLCLARAVRDTLGP